METQLTKRRKRGLHQSDCLLVSGLFLFYGICILGCIVAAYWGLNRNNQILSRSATQTAAALSTYQAEVSATAAVASTEQTQYEIVDHFDSNKNRWNVGQIAGLEWDGSQEITSGVMVWNIDSVNQYYYDFAKVSMEIVPVNDFIKNYDVYVDTKVSNLSSDIACSGLVFRLSPLGWNTGGYSFVVCNGGYLVVHYHNIKDGWQMITSQYHPSIHPNDWNRLGIKVRDSHFVLLINNQVVYEMYDERQPSGGVELMALVEKSGTKILFDNFGYQSR